MTVRYTPEAIHDLQALRDYIGKILGNPKAASRIAKLILDTCGQLKNHPQLGASGGTAPGPGPYSGRQLHHPG